MIFYVKDDRGIGQDGRVVSVGGELDPHVAPRLADSLERVIDGGTTRVVVDMSEVTFIDSTSLGILVAALQRLRRSGGSLELVCAHPYVRRTFEISGLDGEFRIHDSFDEALAGAAVGQ